MRATVARKTIECIPPASLCPSTANFNSWGATMHRILLIVLSFVGFSTWGFGQEVEQPRVLGYGFFAPGFVAESGQKSGVLHLGGGGEARIYKGLGAGAELGYLYPRQSFRDGFGLLSANGIYHFQTEGRAQKVIPFATAGYSLAFRDGSANLFNFGGGIDYWASEKVAVRLEARDHVWPNNGDPATHFVTFRIGLVGW